MTAGTSAILLAGGRSARFGSDKALAPWNGAVLVEAVARNLSSLFSEVLVVTRRPEVLGFLPRFGVRLVEDLYPAFHPLGGICSGLSRSGSPRAFVCACDMPFIRHNLVGALCEAGNRYLAAVPVWEGFPQPLCAVYARECIGAMTERMREGSLGLKDLLSVFPTRFLLEPEVARADPRGLSFTDIDTPEDYERARSLLDAR